MAYTRRFIFLSQSELRRVEVALGLQLSSSLHKCSLQVGFKQP